MYFDKLTLKLTMKSCTRYLQILNSLRKKISQETNYDVRDCDLKTCS